MMRRIQGSRHTQQAELAAPSDRLDVGGKGERGSLKRWRRGMREKRINPGCWTVKCEMPV